MCIHKNSHFESYSKYTKYFRSITFIVFSVENPDNNGKNSSSITSPSMRRITQGKCEIPFLSIRWQTGIRFEWIKVQAFPVAARQCFCNLSNNIDSSVHNTQQKKRTFSRSCCLLQIKVKNWYLSLRKYRNSLAKYWFNHKM